MTPAEIARELDLIAARQAWHDVLAAEMLADVSAELDRQDACINDRIFSALDIGRLIRLADQRLDTAKRALVARLGVEPEAAE